MAIRSEYVENGERIRQYSDLGVKIREIGTDKLYDEAVEFLQYQRVYEETNEPIEETPLDSLEALNIILGGQDGTY